MLLFEILLLPELEVTTGLSDISSHILPYPVSFSLGDFIPPI